MTSGKQENSSKKRFSVIKTIVDLAFVAFCTGLSMFYLFVGNLTELRFYEIALPLVVFTAIGWVLYFVLRLLLKTPRKAAFLSGIVMAIVTNAGVLTGAIGYIAVLLIALAVIASVFLAVIKLTNENTLGKIEYILTAVIAGLILFNTAVSIPQLAENKRLSKEAEEKTATLEEIKLPEKYAGGEAELPNFYIFIFDELAGTQCMSEVFGYDNTGFYHDMRELGFSVSDDCTNYRQFTMETLSGLFNLDYVFSYETDGAFACEEQFRNAQFFGLMKDMGYSLYETEVSGFVGFEPRIEYHAGKKYHTTEDGSSTLDIIMDRTIFRPLVDAIGIIPPGKELYDEILAYYTLPESYKYENAMTFTYICCPHAPFIYDINGNPVDEENRMNWTDSKYFLEQYEYICGRITDTMQGIVENDPSAVILVLSDHGVKANKYLWDGPETNYEQSTDTFFAVYTGGRDDLGDITGLSGANVLRTVLNNEYGFDLNMTGSPED